MHVEQTSIFLENKVGRLAQVTLTLAKNEINIKALSLADTSEFGILRLIVAEPQRAKKVLKEQGFTVGQTDVVAVEVSNTPGGLTEIVQVMSENGVNIEYMYGFPCKNDNAVMIFKFDLIAKAIESLQKRNFRILKAEEVYA